MILMVYLPGLFIYCALKVTRRAASCVPAGVCHGWRYSFKLCQSILILVGICQEHMMKNPLS